MAISLQMHVLQLHTSLVSCIQKDPWDFTSRLPFALTHTASKHCVRYVLSLTMASLS